MLRLLRNRRAQNTAEYAIMIVIVIGVFSAMQLYIRRGLQARIKGGMDNAPSMVIGQSGVAANLLGSNTVSQYEPYYTRNGTENMSQVGSEGTERGTISTGGGIREVNGATSSRNGYQTMAAPVNE